MFFPLYSLVMDWVFPLKLSYRIESLRIWEHLMYVLRGIPVVTMGYSIDSLDVCFGDQLAGSAHEPMHRGWHTFSSWLSGRNFEALFEVLCVGLSIMNMNLLWCYFCMNSWLDRSKRIASCYFGMNSRIDWSEIIALRWFRTLQTIMSYVLR